jgi:hypothetical protein
MRTDGTSLHFRRDQCLFWVALGVHPDPGRRCYVRAAAVTDPPDDRSGLAKAYDWAWRIMAVSLVMVLPGAAGYWIDTRLGTVCLFLVVGLGLGSFTALRLLLRIVQESGPTNRTK